MQPEFDKEEQEDISMDEEDFEEEYEDEEDEFNDDIDDESPDSKGTGKANASRRKGKKSKTVCSEDIKNEILDKVPFAKIDGRLYRFNGRYFVPVKSQAEVESIIYNNISDILRGAPMRILREAAYIIYKLQDYPNLQPDEAYGYLGFQNGIYAYNRSTGDQLGFISFSQLAERFHSYTSQDTDSLTEMSERSTDPSDSSIVDVASINKNLFSISLDTCFATTPLPIKITHTINASFMSRYIEQVANHPPTTYVFTCKDTMGHELVPSMNTTNTFLSQICGKDETLITRIYEMIGCILVPDPSVKKFFLLEGLPDTGKSVLGNFIKSFFPAENVASLDLARLGDKYSSAMLPGAYLNVSMDLPNSTISVKSIAMLKMLTGDDDITVEPKFQNAYSYRNRCRFLFASNHHIRLAEEDQAFINRLVLIPFKYTIPPEKQNPNLLEELKAERSVVANWAIRFYYPLLKRRNFVFSGQGEARFNPVVYYPDRYVNSQKRIIQEFADNCCHITGNSDDWTYTSEIYRSYMDFCKKKNLEATSDIRQFSRWLKELLGNQVDIRRKHTLRQINGRQEEINQWAYTGLRMLVNPMIGLDEEALNNA